jgi:hypothetical protein
LNHKKRLVSDAEVNVIIIGGPDGITV